MEPVEDLQDNDVAPRRVQPRVSRADLRSFDGSPEAERLARLEADQHLMLRLSLDGFAGPAWEEVATALVEYGHSVLLAWIVTGLVFIRCRERGLGGDLLRSPRGGIPRHEGRELASDTVAEAIVRFRDRVLRTGQWDPARGASLTTFFVGNCLLQFPNVYRCWRRRWVEQQLHEPLERSEGRAGSIDPARRIEEDDALARRIRQLAERDRPVAALLAAGYRIDEIAELLGVTYKSVESRLYRLRAAARARVSSP